MPSTPEAKEAVARQSLLLRRKRVRGGGVGVNTLPARGSAPAGETQQWLVELRQIQRSRRSPTQAESSIRAEELQRPAAMGAKKRRFRSPLPPAFPVTTTTTTTTTTTAVQQTPVRFARSARRVALDAALDGGVPRLKRRHPLKALLAQTHEKHAVESWGRVSKATVCGGVQTALLSSRFVSEQVPKAFAELGFPSVCLCLVHIPRRGSAPQTRAQR